MGKARFVYTAPRGARKSPGRCLGCGKGIVYGDRCPPCQQQVRVNAAKRRRKR